MKKAEETAGFVSIAFIARVALWVALFLLLTTGGVTLWIYTYATAPGPDTPTEMVNVNIPKGASVKKISSLLGENEIIYDDFRFHLLARILGASSKLQAGEFGLATGKTPVEVIEYLVVAKQVQHAVTIPEGLRIEEIATIFSQEGWCDKEEFIELAGDSAFIKSLGYAGLSSLEGYLFPDTYYLNKEIHGAETLIKLMLKRFEQVWQTLPDDSASEMSKHQILTLASIVEKETGSQGERAKVAGVFTNRLKRGMRLQSDPTVIYGVDDFEGKITKKHLKAQTPYNTYVIKALPPGPISNPGKSAILATIQPEQHEYLYFVSENDGSHYFSKSLKEHNRAVQRFRKMQKQNSQ